MPRHWNNLLHHPLVTALSKLQCPATHPRGLEDDNKTAPNPPSALLALSPLWQRSSSAAGMIFYEEVKENWQHPRVLFYSSSDGL